MTESQIQAAAVSAIDRLFTLRWRDLCVTYPDGSTVAPLYAIPNGGHRHPRQAATLKREGVRSGVPDLFLAVARHGFGGLYIEMKTTKGRLSKNQQQWCAQLVLNGYCVVVCRSAADAVDTVIKYMGGKIDGNTV